MQKFWDLINYLFGVSIIPRDDILIIEDRRPTLTMVLSVAGLVAIVVIAAWGWLTGTLKIDAITIAFSLVAFVAALFFILRGNFREVYVFDKERDTYTFTRQSVLNRDVLEGAASQFRAVQIERRTDDDDDKEIYAVSLLMQGMLLGQSDRQILREKPPLLNSLDAEKRIAAAIAKFLNIPREGVIDVL